MRLNRVRARKGLSSFVIHVSEDITKQLPGGLGAGDHHIDIHLNMMPLLKDLS